MPYSLRRKRIEFSHTLRRSELSTILKHVWKMTGFPIVADDWMNSNSTLFTWVLTDKDVYTVEEALSQIAKAFGHRIEYRNGVLYVITAVPGLDMRSEPPAAFVERLLEMSKKKEKPSLKDYLTAGRLSRRQLDNLVMRPRSGIKTGTFLVESQWHHKVLQFMSLLSEKQLEEAKSKKGLSATSLTRDLRRAYFRVAGVGLPSKTDWSGKRPGFYLLSTATDEGESLKSIFISDTNPPIATEFRLELAPPPKS